MSFVKGTVSRVNSFLANRPGEDCAVGATQITVQEIDANGDVQAHHDCAGITWDHPALAGVMDGDEVEVNVDQWSHIIDFKITKHF